MTTLREAAQQALEALELDAYGEPPRFERDAAITALRTALVSDALAPLPRGGGESTGPVAGASTRAAHNPNPLGGPATRFRVIADRLAAGEDYAAVLQDMGLADVPAKPVRSALAEPQTTHSAECYKWHHGCAIAEVERLRGAEPAEAMADEPKRNEAKRDKHRRTEAELRRLHALNAELVEALRALSRADFGAGEWGEDAERAALMARVVLEKVESK